MFFHVILTTNCDLKCKYCYEKSCEDIDCDFKGFNVDYNVPSVINYDVELLCNFLKKDKEPSIIFYGGEPLLCFEKLKELMDKVKVKHFNIQTNALHLDKLESEYVNRFSTIFVSIDGKEELTDFYRGNGVYKKVIDNLINIKQNGFKNEIIARMTIMEETDIYENVRWLLNNPDFSFNSIHWQLDAGFWKNDFTKRDFKKWIEHNYNLKLKKLVKFWVKNMEKNGIVLRLYPFLGVMHSILNKENCLLRCGSGWSNYSIQTDGNIIPCPAMIGMNDYYMGQIEKTNPLELRKFFVETPCTNCNILLKCGGRCLYANITKQWSPNDYNLVCKTVKNHINSLDSVLPRIKKLIDQKRIRISDFEHVKYNSCEVIP
jgi:putative peptide-modifying radical SAM enzyme